ncbi:MAG: transporter, family, fosmidomycin resistance protein [Solirubrobacteraceae bacterium]|nr:transporter, family, fosmidomycin resistance protein [Solirubrobacteraceae bacterium]
MTDELDRGLLARLSCGHAAADLCQGSVPALLPFFVIQRGWSYAAAGVLVLAMTVGSSIIQPLFGAVADRLEMRWLMPGGVLLAGIGISLAGVVHSYALTLLVVAISGIGVAAFHPEGARFANHASGSRRGTGMSFFSVGGNVGFALGPILTTPLVLLFGLEGTLALVALPAVAAVLLAQGLPRMHALAAAAGRQAKKAGDQARDDWSAFSRLGGVVAMRSGVYFGLQSFVPLWFVHHLGSSEAAGNSALTAMLVAGAVGTLVGGRLVDRIGRRVVLVGSTALQLPLLVAFVVSGSVLAGILIAAIGFVTIMSFSVTVVMGQEYLPRRLGLASGVTLGAAIGLGGVAAALLGVLADAAGLPAVMWTVALLPIPGLLLALTLPPTPQERVQREPAPASAARVPARI